MSQHFYPTEHQGRPATILIGWDRPLQGYFMVIEDDGTDDDQFIYSNLEDPALPCGVSRSLDPFQRKLAELGLALPASVLDAVRADAAANTGNRYVAYDKDGNVAPL